MYSVRPTSDIRTTQTFKFIVARTPFSVVIITLNEERNLGKCLASVKFADEIVVVDSGSTDKTLEIAKNAGATTISQTWLGYGEQKQLGVDQASNDWVLCIDADETISEQLRHSILAVLEEPRMNAYEMPRRNRFLGRWLRHGEGYPDMNLRFFNRRYAKWSDDAVHEKVIANCAVGKLAGDLLHESEQGIQDYLAKQNRYTSLQAQIMFDAGKRVSVVKLLTSPVFRFIKFYLVRLGFVDGLPGLVHILIGCMNSFFKYAKLIEKWKNT